MNNKKGQIGVISVILALIVFFTLWGMFFASWLSYWAQSAITLNNLTGIEAFLLTYMNLWVFIGVVFGALAVIYFGGGE